MGAAGGTGQTATGTRDKPQDVPKRARRTRPLMPLCVRHPKANAQRSAACQAFGSPKVELSRVSRP
ncbi:hypothetical protein RB2654_08247 [Rhodobacterales bacterium HTCC2654]|uniref:Uncharacterized protein n=1 Tax=Maritimibacter alkaliphilus HTCC2654 TaxID=314271 RepID=A3VHJ0_9RHOB|nr:hypothetical protein RB2654_08247 [Rhodobacterales bacterium HTCC2654] [Maritimibacter alkaliphilus HTCC2654]